jgi:hypothetical protein
MKNIDKTELFHRKLTLKRLKAMAAQTGKPLRKTARAGEDCPISAFLPIKDEHGYELSYTLFNTCTYIYERQSFTGWDHLKTYAIECASDAHREWWRDKSRTESMSVVRWIEKQLKAEKTQGGCNG